MCMIIKEILFKGLRLHDDFHKKAQMNNEKPISYHILCIFVALTIIYRKKIGSCYNMQLKIRAT